MKCVRHIRAVDELWKPFKKESCSFFFFLLFLRREKVFPFLEFVPLKFGNKLMVRVRDCISLCSLHY